MTLDKFIRAADHLVEFEASLNENKLPTTSLCLLETHRDEIKGIWNRLKQIYEKCLVELANGEDDGKETEATRKRETESVKEKYKSSYSTYCRCVSKISELMANLGSSYSASSPNSNSSFNLPPIELNVFHGDFKSWPTFRDMFTAVCIKNSKLSPVEKLFHLTQKTKGEAHEIVSKSPLTDDGFGTAWSNLCARYENKRVLVNEQLKTLFNLSAICSESASSIKGLQRDINACISILRVHKIDIESWNPIFVFLCSNCLPDSTLTLWEQTLNDKTCIPKWSELDEFLTNRYRTLESVSEIRGSKEQKPSNSRTKGNNNSKQISGKISTFQANISQHTCKLCSNEVHVIRKCPKFLKMNYQQRWTEIKSKGLCANCFASSHTAQRCKSKYSCFKCGKRHNSLLHNDSNNHSQSTSYSNNSQRPRNDPISNPLIPPSSPSNIQSTDSSNGVIQTCFASNSNGVLLGTAMVRILHSGVVYRARALLDSGSEGTLISERLSNMLRLPSRHTSATISGLNNSVSAAVQKECCFVLGSESDLNFELFVSALVVPHLSNNLPSRTIDIQRLSDLPPLQLADPKFYESSKIDILLGADVFPSIMLSKNELGICGSLMAQETVFGWILTGPIFTRNNSSCSARVSFFCEISLDKQISRFWEVENIPKKRFLSHEDKICEDLYRKTTRRNEEGRYVVSLPFKESFPEKLCLGSSRSGAMAQFLRNESRLIRNPDLKQEYDKSLIEYVTLNHMSLIDSPSPIQMCYYLPHHAVIKPERTTTKVRVVFNASAPSSNGISLNDVLYTGPVLQNDLTVLILKWRFYKFVLNGDIQKMYRQILVNASHTPFQRILFRENPNNPVQEFELKTVTFGLNCAPYLAIRTIIQLANDVQEKYPLASKILRNSIYVDDALLGAHSIEMAIKSRDELIQALNSAGFHMRKWISNSKKILKGLPTEHLLCADFLEFEDRSSAKTLGVRWNALSDQFYFSTIKFPDTCSYTKREVLSQISKLFDPAGWLSPIIIIAKIIMQRIWLDRTEWDAIISPESLRLWKAFQANYNAIDDIRIPRWIAYSPDCKIEFHCFSDASEKAYSAVIYIRVICPSGISTNLISAKTKVAPLKTLSIPRLELCGSTLLAEMIDNLLPQFEIENYSLFCWTDSTIVLSWLAKPPCCWNTFVANRVSKIIQVVDISKWFHVDSEFNPADLASRGVQAQDLQNNRLWWNGPDWLSEPSKNWPRTIEKKNFETELEKKPVKVLFTYFQNFEDILDRFSSFSRALRAFYPDEYMTLNSKKSIKKSSPLLSLNPFIDQEGIMRICGRLESSSDLSFNERHPIILPYGCQYSRLLVHFIHQISLHGGNQLVLRLAIHLEATTDLSTSAFLAAFSRFVSRRGCPLHLHSDNGTTFVGASKTLSKEFIQTSRETLTSNYLHQNLTWHFIPPGAPHMGGLWEAGVKSFKQHFRKTVGVQKFTFEEFQTLLSKIEACLNSRPISPSSENPTDLTALTPGHFLIGSPILMPLEPELVHSSTSIQNRWQRIKAQHQFFCSRWKNEYLKELQKRHKWKRSEEDLRENMLVVVKEENLPPNSWRLGRITKVHHGNDNRVRVAEVHTQKGTITRPITKLVVLYDESS
ncbi:uncharacterized protein LOC142235353 [Haematobia irritans]|uniref:uncharacterized protein LOC142235353 n=1 Tax=Haematobia irritans TaxID=7368 RepID=UPI003F4FAA69